MSLKSLRLSKRSKAQGAHAVGGPLIPSYKQAEAEGGGGGGLLGKRVQGLLGQRECFTHDSSSGL